MFDLKRFHPATIVIGGVVALGCIVWYVAFLIGAVDRLGIFSTHSPYRDEAIKCYRESDFACAELNAMMAMEEGTKDDALTWVLIYAQLMQSQWPDSMMLRSFDPQDSAYVTAQMLLEARRIGAGVDDIAPVLDRIKALSAMAVHPDDRALACMLQTSLLSVRMQRDTLFSELARTLNRIGSVPDADRRLDQMEAAFREHSCEVRRLCREALSYTPNASSAASLLSLLAAFDKPEASCVPGDYVDDAALQQLAMLCERALGRPGIGPSYARIVRQVLCNAPRDRLDWPSTYSDAAPYQYVDVNALHAIGSPSLREAAATKQLRQWLKVLLATYSVKYAEESRLPIRKHKVQ